MKLKKYLTSGLICSLLLNNIGFVSYAFNSQHNISYYNNLNLKNLGENKNSATTEITEVEKPFKFGIAGTLLNNRINATSQVIDNKAYIIGGHNNTGILKTLEIYDLDKNTSYNGSSMPTPRTGLTSAIINGKIYCIGGQTTSSSSSTTSIVEIYDPQTDTWTTGKSLPSERTEFTASVINNKIYCIGGQVGSTYLNTVEVYDPLTDSWTVKMNMPTSRGEFSSVVFDNKIYCFGGYNGKVLNITEIYNPDTNTWDIGNSSYYYPRNAVSEVIDGSIYVIMRQQYYSSNYSTYIDVYNPKNNLWHNDSSSEGDYYQSYNATSFVYKGYLYMIGGEKREKQVNYFTVIARKHLVLNYADSFAEGDGSKDNPYQISTASELSRLSHLINDEYLNTQNMYFELINNIDLNKFDTDNSSLNGNWIPIGIRATRTRDCTDYYYEYAFRGIFNGNGYTISNLKIENLERGSNLGLFGGIERAEISNLNVTDIQISEISYTVQLGFGGNIGGLVGRSMIDSKFKNIHITGKIYGEKVGGLIGRVNGNEINLVDDCSTDIEIIALDSGLSNVGGLIGLGENLIINNCHSRGTITGNDEFNEYVGGFIGFLDNSGLSEYADIVVAVENSTSDMKISLFDINEEIGGFIGHFCGHEDIQSYIENCHSYSEINLGSDNYMIGGFIGYICDYLILENNYSTGFIKGDTEEIGGFIGGAYVLEINNCYSLVDIEGAIMIGGVIGDIEQSFASIKNYYYAGNINKAFNIENSEFYPMVVTSNYDIDLNDTTKNSNIYYDKGKINTSINNQNLNIPKGLSTDEMYGKESKTNMNLDYDNTWKVNKEFYPTFEQINTAPDIIPNDKVVDSVITISQYDNFNPLDYVTVEDFEGDEFTTQIKEGVDTSKYGPFFVTYVATDNKGLSSELTLTLNINPLPITINEAPIIKAENITLTVGDKFIPLERVEVSDKEDGNLIDETKVIENTVDTNKAGIYSVTYEVTDKDGAKTTKTITVTVKDKLVANNNQNNSDTNDKNNDKDKDIINNIAKPQTYDLGILIYLIFFTYSICVLILNNKKHNINK